MSLSYKTCLFFFFNFASAREQSQKTNPVLAYFSTSAHFFVYSQICHSYKTSNGIKGKSAIKTNPSFPQK